MELGLGLRLRVSTIVRGRVRYILSFIFRLWFSVKEPKTCLETKFIPETPVVVFLGTPQPLVPMHHTVPSMFSTRLCSEPAATD